MEPAIAGTNMYGSDSTKGALLDGIGALVRYFDQCWDIHNQPFVDLIFLGCRWVVIIAGVDGLPLYYDVELHLSAGFCSIDA